MMGKGKYFCLKPCHNCNKNLTLCDVILFKILLKY